MILESKNIVATNVVELEITVSAEEFEKAVQASYKKNIGKMNVPGFRKGKAPRKMVEKMYGEGVFQEDAINELYPSAYDEAVKESGITPVDKASIDVVSVDANGFKFKAQVTVKPEVSVKEYKGLKVEKIIYDVSEEDVQNEITSYQKRQSRLVETAEGTETAKGDTVVFDFEGFVDGVAFEGGQANDYTLVLGSNQFIPGFEDQMYGKKAGEEFSVNVNFPEDYHAEELKAKEAEFKIKLHEIKREELPELNDEFAKDISEFDTFEEFKADLKTKIADRKNNQSESELETQLTDLLAELVEAEIPECMFEQEIDISIQNFERRFTSQGMSLQGYLEYTGQTLESMRAMFKPNAEKDVKCRLALEKIAELEQIIIEESDVNAEYEKFSKDMGMDIEKIKSDYVTERIMQDLSVRKAFEAVKNNAEINEVKAADKEKELAKKAEKEAKAKAKAEATAEADSSAKSE